MGPHVINDVSSALLIQTIFIILFMFPDHYSLILWNKLLKKWAMTREIRIIKRNRAAKEKIKKYWEIDIRKFK